MIIRALGLSIHRINANQSLQRTGENPPAADLFVMREIIKTIMHRKLLIAFIILIIVAATFFYFYELNPLIPLVAGGIAWFMFHFLWSPPPKHKNFSDRDRLEATSRAMGGSGAPPELPTPDVPEKKHPKHKDK